MKPTTASVAATTAVITALLTTGCSGTAVQTSTVADTSTSAAPAAETGGTLTIDNNGATREVTVSDYSIATPMEYGLPAGGQLVDVTVTIRGVDGTTNVNPLYFSARAADGTNYPAALGTIDGQLETSTVPAGDVIKGDVAFDVTGPPVESIRYVDELGGQLASWTVGALATPAAPAPTPASEQVPVPVVEAPAPEPAAPAEGNPVDDYPNPYPNSVDNAQGSELVGCADENYQPGTGIYANGTMDFAAPCLPGGSLNPN